MEMHGMKTVESGQYCAKEEILKAKMGSDTYRNSGNTSREFNFVTAGELTVTITLNEYRELITEKNNSENSLLTYLSKTGALKMSLIKQRKRLTHYNQLFEIVTPKFSSRFRMNRMTKHVQNQK